MLTLDDNHTYRHDNHQFGRSVTEVADSYMPPFPREAIANATAKRDKIEPKDVTDKWDLNAEISRDYGNSVHKAIEYYLTYGLAPTQLTPVVIDFVRKWSPKGSISSEVAVYSKELDLCGTMDMFEDLGDKKCIIHDIKTNAELEKKTTKMMSAPFDDLKATKINNYRLQLSIYKHLLELLGWEVVGMYLWHWNGREWVIIEVEPLETKQII